MALGLIAQVDAQANARKCTTTSDCLVPKCCGMATPQDARYGKSHKICNSPSKTLYLDFDEFRYDFKCDAVTNTNTGKNQYEDRFWQNFKKSSPENVNGYGVNNPYVPPISSPKSLLGVIDKYTLTSTVGLFAMFTSINAWWENVGTGDVWDGFWYNNAEAAGTQIYPTGLGKYYDIYSVQGLINYLFSYIWVYIQMFFLNWFTLFVPIDVWSGWLGGKTTASMWMWFVFYNPLNIGFLFFPNTLIAKYFGVSMEDGWGILEN